MNLRVFIIVICLLAGSAGYYYHWTHKAEIAVLASPFNLSQEESNERLMASLMAGAQDEALQWLASGANPNARNRFGDTALIWATNTGNEVLLKDLIQRGADPNLKGSFDKTALHWSAKKVNPELVRILLKAGAEADCLDRNGETPLMVAAGANNSAVMRQLLRHGVDANATNSGGETALFHAVRNQASDAVETLLLKSPRFDLQAPGNKAALRWAIRENKRHYFLKANIEKAYPELKHILESLYRVKEENNDVKPELDLAQMERHIHRLVNQYRKQHQLQLLEYDEALAAIARNHSRDMNEKMFFDHVNQEGENPTVRAKRQGFQTRAFQNGFAKSGIGENIYQRTTYASRKTMVAGEVKLVSYDWLSPDQLVRSAVDAWLNSPGHRANILTEHYTREGIGIAVDEQGKMSFTQNFW